MEGGQNLGARNQSETECNPSSTGQAALCKACSSTFGDSSFFSKRAKTNSATVTLTAFPKASAADALSGRNFRSPIDCSRAHSRGVIYLCSHATIGICVVVIATKDGAVVARFTRTPDARN